MKKAVNMAGQLHITDHAAIQFQARTGCRNTLRAHHRIKRLLKSVRKVSKIRANLTAADIEHRSPVDYYAADNFIFVVEQKRVITVYKGKKGIDYI